MSHYYFNAMLGSKILTCCTILNKLEQNKIKMAQKCCQKTVSAKSGRNPGRNLFLPGWFKPV